MNDRVLLPVRQQIQNSSLRTPYVPLPQPPFTHSLRAPFIQNGHVSLRHDGRWHTAS